MVNKRIGKINWKKGAGEFISYTVSVILLVYLFLLIISLMILNNANGTVEEASSVIGRDVVTCKTIDEARTKAQREAEIYLKRCGNIKTSSIKAEINYAGGSEQSWKKGNFIDVNISGYVKTCEPFTSGVKSSSITIMIERNGG